MMETTTYRLELARGFLREAQEDLSLQRWRSSISNAQLVAENALKAVVSLFAPVAKTHDPANILLEMMARRQIPAQWQPAVQQLAEASRPLGPQLHVQTDYGDEFAGRLPWEIFDRTDAEEAVALAHDLLRKAEELIRGVNRERSE